MPDDIASPEGPPNDDAVDHGPPPDPHAFVADCGQLFIGIGIALMCGTCCAWVVAERITSPAGRVLTSDDLADRWLDHLFGAEAITAVVTVCLMLTLLAGLALLTCGVGLYALRRLAAQLAVGVTAGAVAGAWLIARAGWLYGIVPGVMALLFLLLVPLALRAAHLLKVNPPPPDHNVATEEFLEELAQARRQRHR